jgi:hypothetical protein
MVMTSDCPPACDCEIGDYCQHFGINLNLGRYALMHRVDSLGCKYRLAWSREIPELEKDCKCRAKEKRKTGREKT